MMWLIRFLYFVCCINFLHADPSQTITFTGNTNNNSNSNEIVVTTPINVENPINLTSPISITNTIVPPVHEERIIYLIDMKYFDSIKSWIRDKKDGITTFFGGHKRKIGLFISMTLYFGIIFYIVRDNHFLNSEAIWGNWQKNCNHEAFFSLSHDQLSNDLIVAIQKKHLDHSNPTNFITPFVHFIAEIETEIKRISWYIRYTSLLNKTYLAYFLPINHEKCDQAQAILARSQFLKQLFLNWTATHNLLARLRSENESKLYPVKDDILLKYPI